MQLRPLVYASMMQANGGIPWKSLCRDTDLMSWPIEIKCQLGPNMCPLGCHTHACWAQARSGIPCKSLCRERDSVSWTSALECNFDPYRLTCVCIHDATRWRHPLKIVVQGHRFDALANRNSMPIGPPYVLHHGVMHMHTWPHQERHPL